MSESCVLCSTRDGQVPIRKLYEDDLVFAIDVPPDLSFYQGPVHFLVITNEHVPSALYLTDDDAAVAGRLFAIAAKLARAKGIADTGFRLATNVGPDAHQEVFHLHLHCVGGRELTTEC